MPKELLLLGLPGTGETLLAKVIAGKAGVGLVIKFVSFLYKMLVIETRRAKLLAGYFDKKLRMI